MRGEAEGSCAEGGRYEAVLEAEWGEGESRGRERHEKVRGLICG